MIKLISSFINKKLNKYTYSKKISFIVISSAMTSFFITFLLCYTQNSISYSLEKQLKGLTYIEHLGRLLNNILAHQIASENFLKDQSVGKDTMENSRVSIDTDLNSFLEILRKDIRLNKIFPVDEELKVNSLVSQFKQKWEDIKRQEVELNKNRDIDALFNELVSKIRELYTYITYHSELIMNIDSGTHRLIDVVIYNLIDTGIMLPKLIAMGDIHLNSGVTATQRVNLMVLKNLLQKNADDIAQSFRDSIKENSVLNDLLQGSETQAFLGEYINAVNYFLRLIETKLLKHVPPDITVKEYSSAGINVLNDAVELENNTISILKKLIGVQIGTLNYRRSASLIFVIFGTILVFLFYLSKAMRMPLDNFMRGIEQFASGDLSVRIKITSKDEVAEMSKEFNRLAENFEAVIQKFKVISTDLSKYSKNVKESTLELEKNIHNQEHAILNIACHAKGISKTVHDFRTQLNDVNYSVLQTSQLAERGLGSLNEMKQVINDMDEGSANIVTSLTDLQRSVSVINTVINEIIKIVDQANLLSLNSAITANRSGLKGAGFTVVSEKIKELADQTAYFTLDIEERVKDIAPKVILGVNSVEKFTESIKKQANATQQINDELQKLISYTQSQKSMFEIVNTSMINQLNGSMEIDSSISELAEIAGNATKAISCLLKEIDFLCETTNTIESILAHFKITQEKQSSVPVQTTNMIRIDHAKNIELLKSILKASKKEQINTMSKNKAE